jgi:hypothetical protein
MLKTLTTGAAALGFAMVATAGQAAPVRLGASAATSAAAPVQTVQFYYESYDDYDYVVPAPVYRPSYRVYRAPPAYDYYAPRPVYRTPVPAYGYYDREDAKDYVKGYRRAQKEIFKDRVRAWNRTHGF